MIIEHRTSLVLPGWSFFTIGVRKVARVGTVELVGRDTVTRLKIVTTNGHFHSRLLRRARTNTVLFRKLTGCTLGGITSGGLDFACG